jgi:hypothetical protein
VGQQPNLQLHLEDLPRPRPHPGPARRWSARRPGDPAGPEEVPWGGAFGTPGPDAGYALHLLAGRPLALAEGERRADAERLAAVLMAARASRLGRAPVAGDAEVAEMILGLHPGGPAAAAAERRRFAADGAEGLRRLLEAVDADLLVASPTDVRRDSAAGERLVG